MGRAHLPPERIAESAPSPAPKLDTESLVSEAMGGWRPVPETAAGAPRRQDGATPRGGTTTGHA